MSRLKDSVHFFLFFFSMGVFFHEHSQTTGLQGKEEGISLTPHYHFLPLHRHLDISPSITPTPLSRLPLSLILTENVKLDGIPAKIKWKIHVPFTFYFKFWGYFLWQFIRCNHQFFHLLLFYISFYMSRHHFSRLIRTSFNII